MSCYYMLLLWKNNNKTIMALIWHSDLSMFYILPWECESLNENGYAITFSMEIWHYMVFVSNWKPSCLPHFDKFATTLSITIFCLSEVFFIELNITMLSCIVWQSLSAFIYLRKNVFIHSNCLVYAQKSKDCKAK